MKTIELSEDLLNQEIKEKENVVERLRQQISQLTKQLHIVMGNLGELQAIKDGVYQKQPNQEDKPTKVNEKK